jgi:hypothetical protein
MQNGNESASLTPDTPKTEHLLSSKQYIEGDVEVLDGDWGQTPWDNIAPPAPIWTSLLDSRLKEKCVH